METKYCNIGGQALIEGVMMKGKSTIAIAVRVPSGEIETKVSQTNELLEHRFFKLPIIRGVVELFKAMVIGIQALTYSADFFMDEEEKAPSKFEQWLEMTFKGRANDIMIALSIVTALAMAILMFAVLPAALTGLTKQFVTNSVVLSLIEGLIKVVMFIAYIVAISFMSEIRRVFEYHGAEHKTIHCYESGMELTPQNAATCTRIHPRCGTSFLLFVMIISIIVFSFVTWHSIASRILYKILLLPVVAGLSYELLKFTAKHDNAVTRLLSAPGLLMQRLTTREPNHKQLAVAIAAMQSVLLREGEAPSCPL